MTFFTPVWGGKQKIYCSALIIQNLFVTLQPEKLYGLENIQINI